MSKKRRKIDKNLLYTMNGEQMKEANELSKQTREEVTVEKVLEEWRENKKEKG